MKKIIMIIAMVMMSSSVMAAYNLSSISKISSINSSLTLSRFFTFLNLILETAVAVCYGNHS